MGGSIKSEKSLGEHKEEIKKELLSSRVPDEIEDESEDDIKQEEPEMAVPDVKPKEVNLPDPRDIYAEKSRLHPKVMTIKGITVIAGGDIKDLPSMSADAPLVEDEKDDRNVVKKEVISPAIRPEEERPSRVAKRRLDKLSSRPKSRLKKILAILAIFAGIIVLLVLSFLFYSYKSASVDIAVSFNQSEGQINQPIVVSTIATNIDSENLVIPASLVAIEEASSADAIATGKKKTGEYAQGVIDIRNKSTESAVNLSQGQILIDISSNLQYELTQNVAIPIDQYQRDVSIKAKNFGEEYNIQDEQSTFRIEGFTTDKLIGFGFRDITGGKTEEITVVSKEDVAKVRKDLETALKGNLQTSLKSQLSTGEILLEGSEKYEEVSFDQSIQIDEEAENFSINLKMKATMVKVKEEDVQAIAEEIIKKSERATEEAEVKVDDFEVKNVKVEGDKVSFELVASGEVNENLKLEEQKSHITGKGIGEAEAYLEGLEQIDQVTIEYKPDFIPARFRKIPANTDQIKFK